MPNGYTEDLGIVLKSLDPKANLYFLFVSEALGEKNPNCKLALLSFLCSGLR